MIQFLTLDYLIDLTNNGISFKENSDNFTNQVSKNFSFPFNVRLDGPIAVKLGLVNIPNVRSYKKKIYGQLIIDNFFYEGYISVNGIEGNKAELTLFYGSESLSVFDKKLNQLPFPVVFATGGLPAFAKTQLSKSWPEATHNFIKVFREELSEKSNYKYFENFVNNYVDDGGVWSFPENTIDLIDGANVSVNRNVMVPMTYLMEVLRVGFKTEGLEMRGDFVNDDFNKKLLLVPQNFMEQYAVSQFDNYSFGTFTTQETINGKIINVYKKVHTPTNVGSFSIKFKVNMSNAVAQYFKLTIVQNGIILYEAFSENKQVLINETLDINIVNTNIFDDIEVELKVSYQEFSIANYNSFTYQYKEGQLNVFPSYYTLADYLPNITFRELINRIKNWLNLKFEYTTNAVYINYLENITDALVYNNKSHLEQVDPKRTLNNNNLFILKYETEEQEVLVNNEGQVYDKSDYLDQETVDLPIKIAPLTVTENFGAVTAVYPESESDIMLCLYDGLTASENLATSEINNRKLDIQHVFQNHWQKWLKYRSNSETYKFSFKLHISEQFNIQEGIVIFNKKHLIKSIGKKRTEENYWKVDIESETF